MASDHPINVTLKAGTGYDAPWITVGGNTPDDVKAKLDALGNVGVLHSAVAAAKFFQSVLTLDDNSVPTNPVAAAVTPPPSAAPVQPQQPAQPQTAWSNPPQQQAQGGRVNGAPDPLGRTCSCGAGVVYKEVTRRADNRVFKFWTCPNGKKKDDGHFSEFAD